MNRSMLSALLIAVLMLGVALPAGASGICCQTGGNNHNGALVGGLLGAAAVVAVIAIVVIRKAHTKTITGCVSSEAGGLTLIDEKDKRIYVLSGNSAGITAGDRVKLRGKKTKGPANSWNWETKEAAQDFGPCHPSS